MKAKDKRHNNLGNYTKAKLRSRTENSPSSHNFVCYCFSTITAALDDDHLFLFFTEPGLKAESR